MAEPRDAAYAPFVALHEVRLVRSLVSESGLSPATAAAVAADVLPAAFAREFSSAGAAHGWLRVAARHRATGSPSWADAADAAHVAAGLDPVVLADRLGVSEAEVLDRIERARDAAVPAARRSPDVSLPRAAAALAAAAAAVFVTVGGGPPALTDAEATGPGSVRLAPPATRTSAGEPVPALAPGDRVLGTGPTAVVAVPRDDARKPVREPKAPNEGGCVADCTSGRLVDELHIRMPEPVEDVTGPEIVVELSTTSEHVPVCDTVPAIPVGVASCVPAEH